MGNVVPMDSKLLSNYWYMSWPSWPTHISNIVFSQKSGHDTVCSRRAIDYSLHLVLIMALIVIVNFQGCKSGFFIGSLGV